jgi:hypothetical protein
MIRDLEEEREERIRKVILYIGILGDAHTYQEQLHKVTDEKKRTISELHLEDF